MNKENYIDLDIGLYLGEGINLETKEEKSAFIEWDDLAGHLLVEGETRSGKTNFMLSLIRQVILKGERIVIIDAKGDRDNKLISSIYDFAIEADRRNDISYLTPMNLNTSLKFNPIYGLTNEEIASLVLSLTSNPHDLDISSSFNIILAVLTGLEAIENDNKTTELPSRTDITFKELSEYSNYDGLTSIFKEVKELIGIDNKTLTVLSDELMNKDIYFSNSAKPLYLTLEQLSYGDIGEILCSHQTNPLVSEFIDNSPILIVQPFPLKYKKASDIFMQIIYYTFSTLYKTEYSKETFFFIDEAGSVLFPSTESLFNNGSGKGLRMLMFSQDFNDYGINWMKDIVDNNTNNKIFLKTKEDKKYAMLNESIEIELIKHENPKYILNKQDLSDHSLNDIYNEFSSLVSDTLLRKIIRRGLLDISLYDFENTLSVNRNAISDMKHLQDSFSLSELLHFENVNLKEHSLNVFSVALEKYRNMEDNLKDEFNLSLVASLFHDFGKSKIIRENILSELDDRPDTPHAKASKIYIDKSLSTYFKEDLFILDKLAELVDNHHPSTSKMRKDKKISFISTSDHKARKIELEIEKNDYFGDKEEYRDKFNDILNNSSILLEKNKSKELLEYIKEKDIFNLEYKSEKIFLYERDILRHIFRKEDIVNISFQNEKTKFGNIVIYGAIFLRGGPLIEIAYLSEKNKDFLINL